MKWFLLVVLLSLPPMLSAGVFSVQLAQASEWYKGEHKRHPPTVESVLQLPSEALAVYEYVLRTGRAPEGYVGGRVWENREHRLPPSRGYREYDIHPKVHGKNRGAERIIVDINATKGWYTGDHYRTFLPIRRRGNDK